MPDLYISTDVETDGPIPGPHSMLSIGALALNEDGESLDTFTANLETLSGAEPDPQTMAWWAGEPEAWAAHRHDLRSPVDAMRGFADWVDQLAARHRARAVFVAWPVGFDFSFVYWYLIRFAGRSPFGHSALDLRSYAMGMLGQGYHQTGQRSLPADWLPEARHTHVALDDAIEQGQLFANMLRANRARRLTPHPDPSD
jgi:hypothetical protein